MKLSLKKLAHHLSFKLKLPHKHAFTLLESLLSLFVFAIIMHSLSMAVTQYYKVEETFRTDKGLEFQLFTKIMSLELETYQFLGTSQKTINLTDQTKHFNIIHSNQKIYKTPGHHPYLYDVQDWQVDWSEPILTITVLFTNLQSYRTHLIID